MADVGLKKLPYPDKADPASIVSNQRTAWENFIKLDGFNTLSVTTSATLTAVSQTLFVNAAGGNITLTVPSASGNTGLTYTIFKTDSTTNTVTIDGNVLGANGGRSRLVLVCDGSSYRVKLIYEEGFYTGTLTGCTTSPTAVFYYTKNGKHVSIKTIATLRATADPASFACTITGMPSHLWPGNQTDIQLANVNDTALNYVGGASISTAGVMTLFYQNTISTRTSTFTNSGTKGIGMAAFSYTTQ
jgi:hypothetical protein